MKQFLKDHKVVFTPAPSGAKRATGMVEKSNDLLEMILKNQFKKKSWPLYLNRGVYELNRRVIKHFGFSPYENLLGYQPLSTLEFKFPSLKWSKYTSEIIEFDWHQLQDPEEVEKHKDAVIHHVARIKTLHRHDIRISQEIIFTPGSLVMLYDHTYVCRYRIYWKP
ncbi:hypothetical protein HI914_06754 [Erysiphe necator]|nr:hypothetical protein HI914_06754 [Erysiphe necator]